MDSQQPFVVETNPATADLQWLDDRINEHNMAVTGYYDFQPLAIFVRDATQSIMAGMSGFTWGRSCKIQALWVRSDQRGQGYGQALLHAAEQEAQTRGCYVIVLDTHSFQAPDFYQKLGYQVVGQQTGFPDQHSHYFLEKRLMP